MVPQVPPDTRIQWAADVATFTGNFGGGFISLGAGNDQATFTANIAGTTILVPIMLTILALPARHQLSLVVRLVVVRS